MARRPRPRSRTDEPAGRDGDIELVDQWAIEEGGEDGSYGFWVRGSTGSRYDVVVGQWCTCTCLDFRIRNRDSGRPCKHIDFVLRRVLRADAVLLETVARRGWRFTERERDDVLNRGLARLVTRHAVNDEDIWLSMLSQPPPHAVDSDGPAPDATPAAVVPLRQPTRRELGLGRAPGKPPRIGKAAVAAREAVRPKEVGSGDDCRICFDALLGAGCVLACCSACGVSQHAACIRRWLAAERRRGQHPAQCPMCRQAWVESERPAPVAAAPQPVTAIW